MPAHQMSRRTLLGLLGTGAATVVVAGCTGGSGSSSSSPPIDASGGDPLAAPPELRSSDGLLEVTLVAAPTMLPWDGGERYALTYNGSASGPTLRLRPGDTLRVTLENRLNTPTNLHTHGLHVSPGGTSDNIFLMVEPGANQSYEYRIPADHPSGLFWYHPHHHGEVAAQVAGGLAGAIVIEDRIDDDPILREATERVLILSDPRIGTDATVLHATAAEKRQGREGDLVLVNGLLQPTAVAPSGTVERWRIVNASSSRYHGLSVEGGSMTLLALDQGRLAAPLDVDSVVLTPGQRAEVLVPLGSSSITLVDTPIDRGATMGMGNGGMGGMGNGGMGGATGSAGGAPVAVLTVTPTGTASPPVTSSPALAPSRPAIEPVGRRRTVRMGAMTMGDGEFVIDGRAFDGDRTDITAEIGTVEEWTVTNDSMMDHPFHLHVWPFALVDPAIDADGPIWRDTVNVPAGASVTIRLPFADVPGRTVYHCHILDHEDLGMMGVIEVT
jgi:FtsP/CotA-like multicopper oxidase with cupredoxin domain